MPHSLARTGFIKRNLAGFFGVVGEASLFAFR
jgi:hypothetical protein